MLRFRRGFSLVELLIVIMILGILMGIAIPNMSEWVASTRVRLKAEGLLGGISLARSHALKRNTKVFFQFGTGASWTIGCSVPEVDRDGDGVAECPAVIEQKGASEGGSNIALNITPNGATTVTYSGMGRLVANPNGSASMSQIDLSTGATATVWRLAITGTGQARVCNPALPAGDTYSCT